MLTQKLEIEGLKEFSQVINDSIDNFSQIANSKLVQGASLLVERLVKKIREVDAIDTGKLAQSVQMEFKNLEADVFVASDYAEDIEDGTKPHYVSAEALKGWAGRKLGNPNLAYPIAKVIEKVGTKPRHFFSDTWDESKTEIQDILDSIYTALFV